MKAIRYSTPALKQLRKIPAADAKRIVAKVEQLVSGPAALANQVKKLQGVDAMRLRVGNYRVIYTDVGLVLLVLKVRRRGSVYE
jgi:mRNA interferase RelE/StbE|nr:type II toxin-antitoxin system RelE/ParE family toxin [uncultured Dongia sp.]